LSLHREALSDSPSDPFRIDQRYAIEILKELIAIESVNPAFAGARSNERAIAARVRAELRGMGLETFEYEPAEGRVSVVGRLAGGGGGPSLMLYAHHDTVGVEGMLDPFSAREQDGRIYGRGAYDMKGGLAACLAATRALVESGTRPSGDLLVASVADEEEASLGMEEVLRHHLPDAAIVTEPTELKICTAHKGFAWIEVVTHGRAAHGSRPHLGIDANLQMARIIVGLAPLEARLRDSRGHPLLGVPSMHVGMLRGGSAPSIYAAECRALVERRTVPGESAEAAISEIEERVKSLADEQGIQVSTRAMLAREPFQTRSSSRITEATARSAEGVLKDPRDFAGVSFWTDAALLAAAGVDTVLLGPIGAGAHAAEEWVDADSVLTLADVLARTARDFGTWR
jgi:acetylornithine deacetylase